MSGTHPFPAGMPQWLLCENNGVSSVYSYSNNCLHLPQEVTLKTTMTLASPHTHTYTTVTSATPTHSHTTITLTLSNTHATQLQHPPPLLPPHTHNSRQLGFNVGNVLQDARK